MFPRSHGVVVGPTVADARNDLYHLERAAEAQVLAMATGRPLVTVPEAVARVAAAQVRGADATGARLHLNGVRRLLARPEPDFAD